MMTVKAFEVATGLFDATTPPRATALSELSMCSSVNRRVSLEAFFRSVITTSGTIFSATRRTCSTGGSPVTTFDCSLSVTKHEVF